MLELSTTILELSQASKHFSQEIAFANKKCTPSIPEILLLSSYKKIS